MKKTLFLTVAALSVGLAARMSAQPVTVNPNAYLMNQAVDVSTDFMDMSNTYFFAERLGDFDPASGEGTVVWRRYHLSPRQAFNTNGRQPQPLRMLDFPSPAYVNDPALKFQIDFVTPRTVRVRMLTTPVEPKPETDEVMLVKEPGKDGSWKVSETEKAVVYTGPFGSVEIQKAPWRLVFRDKTGRLLTQTAGIRDNSVSQVKFLPFSFIKRGSDNARRISPVFSLAADEKCM